MICLFCGEYVNNGDLICPHCGADLSSCYHK
ncbi:zinc-ribbon domain-containing protein [uncultured Methanobrevibacter sp.]